MYQLLHFLIYASAVVISEMGLWILYHRFHPLKRMTHHFTWGKYLYFLAIPGIVLVALSNNLNNPLRLFFVSACVGTICEYVAGRLFHSIVGKRLWSYHILKIDEYTSWLSIAMWGCAGIIFNLIAKI